MLTLLIFASNVSVMAAQKDSITVMDVEVLDPDSVLENLKKPHTSPPAVVKPSVQLKVPTPSVSIPQTLPTKDTLVTTKLKAENDGEMSDSENFYEIDSLVLQGNPFFIDMVYSDDNTQFDWNMLNDFHTLFHGQKNSMLNNKAIFLTPTPEEMVENLRKTTKRHLVKKATHLFVFNKDQLPNPNMVEEIILTGKRVERITFDDPDYIIHRSKNIKLEGIKSPVWYHKASALSQFSGTMISDNWHQGGNSTLAFLSLVNGKLIYDDKKLVQWENTGEWRMGFNWTDIQTGKVNDDVLKINSKFGVKVKNEYYITGSMDLSTQFFDIFKDSKNTDKKTAFFSPFRFNMALGLDYKHKKIISLLVSPISYKFIYVNDPKVNPNQFGIKTGENVLSEFGSAVRITNSYSPVKEIQLDSRFSLYTNYKQVEVDWELVCNLIVNRFISTRIMLNPRFDNTIITEAGKKPELQFKGLMSVGFLHKF